MDVSKIFRGPFVASKKYDFFSPPPLFFFLSLSPSFQVLGDNSVVYFPGLTTGQGRTFAPGPFLFVKGLGSSGDTGTIDDNYPAALLFLWRNPTLLNAMLRPINIFMANATLDPAAAWPLNVSWPYPYSVHYLGQ